MSITIIEASKSVNGYRQPAVGLCHCGSKFELDGDSMGECSCDSCGRVYNIFGQELQGFTVPFVGENEFGERYYEDY